MFRQRRDAAPPGCPDPLREGFRNDAGSNRKTGCEEFFLSVNSLKGGVK